MATSSVVDGIAAICLTQQLNIVHLPDRLFRTALLESFGLTSAITRSPIEQALKACSASGDIGKHFFQTLQLHPLYQKWRTEEKSSILVLKSLWENQTAPTFAAITAHMVLSLKTTEHKIRQSYTDRTGYVALSEEVTCAILHCHLPLQRSDSTELPEAVVIKILIAQLVLQYYYSDEDVNGAVIVTDSLALQIHFVMLLVGLPSHITTVFIMIHGLETRRSEDALEPVALQTLLLELGHEHVTCGRTVKILCSPPVTNVDYLHGVKDDEILRLEAGVWTVW